MTIDDIKRLRSRKIELTALQEQIVRLRAAQEDGRRAMLSGMPGAHSHKDKMAEYIVRLEALEARLLQQKVELEDSIAAVSRWLDTLPPDEATVLRLRYVKGLTWRQVSQQAGYSDNHAYKIQRRAFARLRKLDSIG